MLSETYRFLADREATYWWHRARRDMVLGLLRRYRLPHGCRWLDLGCGPGGNLGLLDSFQPAMVVGVDLSPKAIEIAVTKAPHARIVQADLRHSLPFADGTFDLVTLLNVLYHAWIKSEIDVLAEVRRVLRPGGLAVVTEPALSVLHRDMDVAAMTRRRYRLGELTTICRSPGFNILFASYFTSFGVPLTVGMKAIHKLFARGHWQHSKMAPDMKRLPPFINEPIYWLAAMEAQVIVRSVRIPFGTTLVCVARKS